MGSFVTVLAATAVLFLTVSKGFLPNQDTDQIAVVTEAALMFTTRIRAAAPVQRAVRHVVGRRVVGGRRTGRASDAEAQG